MNHLIKHQRTVLTLPRALWALCIPWGNLVDTTHECIHSNTLAFQAHYSLGKYSQASLLAQMVKSPREMQETRVQFHGLGRSPGEGNGNPLQYSCLENSMDRGSSQATIHGVAESDMTEWLTQTLSTHFLKGVSALEVTIRNLVKIMIDK